MTWSDISYKRYLEIKDKIIEINTENSIEFNIQFVSIVSGIPVETINKISLTKYSKLIQEYAPLFKLPEELELNEFCWNEIKYIIDDNIESFTVEQWSDLEAMQGSQDSIGNVFALLIKKEDEGVYSSKNRLERIDLIYEMPTDIVYGVASFFLQKRIELKKIFQQSIELEKMTEILMKQIEVIPV